jgi:Flp pilus assembly pilin Flp
MKVGKRVQGWAHNMQQQGLAWYCRLSNGARALASGRRGQGTTEYAILVGVLVVIAILAIVIFRQKIQDLWDAISNGINQL